MKLITSAGLIAGLTLAMVNGAIAASAYRFNPGGEFAASGEFAVTVPGGANFNCTANIAGQTNPARIASASFSGGAGCTNIVAINLPWPVKPTTMTNVFILHMTLASPDIGQCGRNELHAALNGGVLSVQDLLPSRKSGEVCSLNASLTPRQPCLSQRSRLSDLVPLPSLALGEVETSLTSFQLAAIGDELLVIQEEHVAEFGQKADAPL